VDLGLSLLAGYWVFRGLAAVVDSLAEEKAKTLVRQQQKAVLTSSSASVAMPVPVQLSSSIRKEPSRTAPVFCDARSLFMSEYVSFTRLDTYSKCARKFKLVYLEGFRQTEADASPEARSGNHFHEVCEQFFNKHRGQRVQSLLGLDASRQEPRLAYLLGQLPLDATVLAAEHEPSFVMRGHKFLGYVDLVLERSDGVVMLVDAKTGYARGYSPDSIQLDIYSLPELLARPDRSIELGFVFVDAKRKRFWTNGPNNRKRVVQEIGSRIHNIEAETRFQPNVSGLCKYCHVKPRCEAHNRSIFRDMTSRPA